jgi:hypothetical protein
MQQFQKTKEKKSEKMLKELLSPRLQALVKGNFQQKRSDKNHLEEMKEDSKTQSWTTLGNIKAPSLE